ncbi:hypothetical protein PMG11_10989 [Penicillium brasilianum]|uniref:DUF7703 domain-containing protein n=1 Tax=Penicillium brasilianum TaxID=104259 RepID=A0A0F7U540_PENBI|nr:hypothetical protein PMG11_10989 [Penicillium brasilianum]
MDTTITNLPPNVGAILIENISIIQIISMFSIGAYNALETGIAVFDSFRRYRGLYFWSMQVASWGILVHTIPAMIRFVSQSSNLAMSIPFILGWYAMVTGQDVVLYSRLNVLATNPLKLRWVLWMIITNFFILHIPTTVLFYGLNSGHSEFAGPAAIYDRIRVTGFCMQELVLSGVYIHQAVERRRDKRDLHHQQDRKVILHLLWINILVVLMNILLLVAEYKLHYIEVSLKTVVYSIKLKLEFTVLNRLRKLGYTPPPALACQMPEYARQDSNANLVGRSRLHSRQESNCESVHTVCGINVPPRAFQRPSLQANREAKYETDRDDTSLPSSNELTIPSATASDHLVSSLSSLELSLTNFTPKFDVEVVE